MANGYYLDLKKMEINLEGRGRKIPAALAIALTPVLGAMFLMFLPMIGFVLCAHALVLKSRQVFGHSLAPRELAVGAAYITGERPGSEGGVATEELARLEQEVRQRRGV